jgi:hypothetical protein
MSRDYNAPTKASSNEQLNAAIALLKAGDTVHAVFYDKHYRTFEITGIVTTSALDEHQYTLASWFLNSPTPTKDPNTLSEGKGKASSFLKELEILSSADLALF